MLNDIEKKVLLHISKNGLCVSPRPFLDVANALNCAEDDVLNVVQNLSGQGVIKSLRGVVNHRKAGYEHNALVAWRCSNDQLMKVKDVFIANDMISHCYEREPQPDFNFNLFTMMHADNEESIMGFVNKIHEIFNLEYDVLVTEEELKKEKMDLETVLCH